MTSALHPARDFGTLPRSVSYTHTHAHAHPHSHAHSHSHSHSHSQGHNAASAALPLLPRRLPPHAQSASAPVSRRASPAPTPPLPSPPHAALSTKPASASPPPTPVPTAVVVQPPTPPTPTATANTSTAPTAPPAAPIFASLASLAPPQHTRAPPRPSAVPESGSDTGAAPRAQRAPFPTSHADSHAEPRPPVATTMATTETTTMTTTTTGTEPHQQKLLLLTPDPQRAPARPPRPVRHSAPTGLALTPIHAPTRVLASTPTLSTPTPHPASASTSPASPAWSAWSASGSIPRKKSGEPLKSSLKSRRPLVRGSLSVLTALSTTTTATTTANNTPASSRAASPGASDTGTGKGASSRSAPATPGLGGAPKNVHFDAQLARVRLYFAGQRPLAVSRGGSPTADAGSGTESEGVGGGGRDEEDEEDEDEEDEEEGEGEGEVRVEMRWVDGLGPSEVIGDEDARDVVLESLELDCGDPASAVLPPHPAAAASTARLQLGAGQPAAATVRGLARVRNVAFEKWVGARFTLDNWQTVSEVSARYVASVARLSSAHGGRGSTEEKEREKEGEGEEEGEEKEEGTPAWDRFAFAIRVPLRIGRHAMPAGGAAAAEPRTLALALRYRAAGREMWDNNGGRDYTVQVAAARETRAKARARGGSVGKEGRSGEGERGFEALRGKLERLEARQSQSASASESPSPSHAHARSQSQGQSQGRSLGQGQTVGGLLARGAPRYDFADSLRSAGGAGAWSPARAASPLPSLAPTAMTANPGGLQAHQRTSTYPASAPSPRGGAAQRRGSRGAAVGAQVDHGAGDGACGVARDDGRERGQGHGHGHGERHAHAHAHAHGHGPRRQPFAGDVGFNFGFGGAAGRGGLGIEFGAPGAQQQQQQQQQGQQGQERLSAHWAPPRARTPSPLHTPLHTPTTTESDTDTEAQRITLVPRHPVNPHQHPHQHPPAPHAHAHTVSPTPRRHTRGGYFDGAGMSGVRRTPPGSPFLRYNSFPPASPAPALAAAAEAGGEEMLSPAWAGAMGRRREMVRAGEEDEDGDGDGTIGRAQGRFVRRLGTDSPVHHLSNYDELLNRFCFYTGHSSPDPNARFEPPADHVPRSHSTSSIDEILAAQSPRAASVRSPDLTPRAAGVAGGWSGGSGGSSGSATPLATLTPIPARTRAGFRQLGQTPSLAV